MTTTTATAPKVSVRDWQTRQSIVLGGRPLNWAINLIVDFQRQGDTF